MGRMSCGGLRIQMLEQVVKHEDDSPGGHFARHRKSLAVFDGLG
jgi:hypothetical protein